MSQYLLPSILNGGLVALGLFALWSFATRMRDVPAGTRATYAVIAGVISAVVGFIVTSWLAGAA